VLLCILTLPCAFLVYSSCCRVFGRSSAPSRLPLLPSSFRCVLCDPCALLPPSSFSCVRCRFPACCSTSCLLPPYRCWLSCDASCSSFSCVSIICCARLHVPMRCVDSCGWSSHIAPSPLFFLACVRSYTARTHPAVVCRIVSFSGLSYHPHPSLLRGCRAIVASSIFCCSFSLVTLRYVVLRVCLYSREFLSVTHMNPSSLYSARAYVCCSAVVLTIR